MPTISRLVLIRTCTVMAAAKAGGHGDEDDPGPGNLDRVFRGDLPNRPGDACGAEEYDETDGQIQPPVGLIVACVAHPLPLARRCVLRS